MPSRMISMTSAILASFSVDSLSIIANFCASDREAGRMILTLRRTFRPRAPLEPSLRRLRWPALCAASPVVTPARVSACQEREIEQASIPSHTSKCRAYVLGLQSLLGWAIVSIFHRKLFRAPCRKSFNGCPSVIERSIIVNGTFTHHTTVAGGLKL